MDESAIGFAAFTALLVSFNYPLVSQKEWLIDIYWPLFLIEQMFDKIRSGLSEQGHIQTYVCIIILS